jgi:HAE1 family hydrophobic/amphiphilic exporter-1
MNLPRFAVQRPVSTLMVLVGVSIIGFIALLRLPLAFLPQVDMPFIGIVIPYPNSNPSQVEKEIAKPVEEALATLSGVKKMRSISNADAAEFRLEFNWGFDLDVVRMQVSEKMDQIRGSLPPGTGEILIFSFNTSDIPVVEARIAAEGVDLSANYDLIETRIINRIRRVPGVARVDVNGVAPRQVYIELVLDKIKEHRVDVGALIGRLQGMSQNLVLGQVREGGLRYSARALGAFESIDAIRDLRINERGLRLSDIAEIAYEQPPIPFGRHLDGKYAVALMVFKESTANTVDVVRGVTRVIHEDIDRDPLLQGVQLIQWQNQAEEITKGVNGLRNSGIVGALLAVTVLYFFLRRTDSTVIVSSCIPFSVLAACGVMYFMGKNLNILSLSGLMIGVGMLVDNAIVVLEAIDRKHRTEPDPKQAAMIGAREVVMAVVCSTLTNVIVFLPLIVGATTEVSTWLGEIGVTISIALVCSLFSSLTLIPMMSARLLRRRQTEPPRSLAWLEARYVRILGWTLAHRRWMAAIVVVGLLVGIFPPFLLKLVDATPFAGMINKRMFLGYEFADFSYKSDSERAVGAIEAYLDANRGTYGLESIYSFFGENEAGTVLTLNRDDYSDRQMKDLRKNIREALPVIPGVRVFFDEEADEGGRSTHFQVKFFGQDSAVLARLSDEAERRLATVAGVQDISNPLHRGRNEIQVVIDRDKALRQGLSSQDLSDVFAFTLGGMRLRRFNTGSKEVETWLELRPEDRQDLDDLRGLQLLGRDGRQILLGDVAAFQVVRRAQEIERENRKVRSAVRATYEGDTWGDARKEIEGLMNAFDLPPGYSWSWDDRILEQGEENQQMLWNFILSLVLVYLVMASLFESVTQPLAILFSIPFAVPGAAWLLAATRTPFNLMAQIGLLILIGIVVNNGIVLLDHMNQLRASGVPREEAILRAGRDRLRAILMTAGTTIVGLIPLAMGGSSVGPAYYFPLARTVMGGMLSSTILTLIVLPYINLSIEDGVAWCRRIWAASAPRTPAASPSGAAVPRAPASLEASGS